MIKGVIEERIYFITLILEKGNTIAWVIKKPFEAVQGSLVTQVLVLLTG